MNLLMAVRESESVPVFRYAFPAIQEASQKWKMSIRDWKPELDRSIMELCLRLGGRL